MDKIDKVVEDHEKRLKRLDQFLIDTDNRLLGVEAMKDPQSIHFKIEDLYQQLAGMIEQTTLILSKLQSLSIDDKYIEVFKDKELKEFHLQSGVSLPELKAFIEKNITKKGISSSEAYKYGTGEVGDVIARSKVGKFLRESAVRKNQLCKTKNSTIK